MVNVSKTYQKIMRYVFSTKTCSLPFVVNPALIETKEEHSASLLRTEKTDIWRISIKSLLTVFSYFLFLRFIEKELCQNEEIKCGKWNEEKKEGGEREGKKNKKEITKTFISYSFCDHMFSTAKLLQCFWFIENL